MNLSLHDAGVATYLQTLDAVAGFLALGLAHCRERRLDPEEITEARIHPDMLPFRFQIQRVVYHSAGAVQALQSGTLELTARTEALDYPALQALIDTARATLRAVVPAELNARAAVPLRFIARGQAARNFGAEEFLLSFSLPNFHFHATTAYNILRARGVALAKRDYMGALRLEA